MTPVCCPCEKEANASGVDAKNSVKDLLIKYLVGVEIWS
jgi:hypothetical protein